MPESEQSIPARATKRCSMCGEDVLAVAVKCKHCKSDLRGIAPASQRPTGPAARARSAAEGAVALRPATRESAQAATSSRPPAAPEHRLPQEIGPVSVVVLSALTAGIFGVVRFHEAGCSYETLAGRHSRFSTLLWVTLLLVPLAVVAGANGLSTTSWVLWAAAVAVSTQALRVVLALRAEVVTRYGLAVRLTGDGTLVGLWILAGVPLLGLIPAAAQAISFFEDHNRLAASLGARP